SSGVDLERSLHQSQAVGLCSARGRCSLLTGSVSSTGGRLFPDEVFPVSTCLGLSYGVWRFGEARVVRVVLHRLVSRRWCPANPVRVGFEDSRSRAPCLFLLLVISGGRVWV
ncbi:unnamed protein product, partial [Brassica napus]